VFPSYLCALLSTLLISATAARELMPGQLISARALSGEELVRIGEIHDVQNHYPEAMTYYEQALAAFRARKQGNGEAIVLTKIGSMYERQGRRRDAAVQLRQALALFSKSPDSPVHADALYASGRVALWVGSHEEAASRFEQAKARYRRLRNEKALAAVMLESGLLGVSDDLSVNGLHEIQQVLDAGRSRRDDEQTITALVALADANWLLDRAQAASALYDEAIVLLNRRPEPTIEAGVRKRLAAIAGITGREREGIEFAKRAVTLYQSQRDVCSEAASWALLASLYEALGQTNEAEEALRRSLVIYRQQGITVHAIVPAAPAGVTVPRGSR